MKLKLALVSAALALSHLAFAQPAAPAAAPKDPSATPKLDQRQVNQQKRIAQGVGSGQLTPKETAHLQQREGKLQADKQAAKADGVVTTQERKKLHREADRTSKAIARQKHDRQRVKAAN